MNSFFSDIVRQQGLLFRGPGPGASLDEVVAIEGEPSNVKEPHPSGSLGDLTYNFELGEVEELKITYSYGPERLVQTIEVYLRSFPFFYWQRTGQKYPDDWIDAMNAAALAPLTPQWAATREELIAHFTAAAGSPPKIGKPQGGFRKKEHDGRTWTWTTPTLNVWMLSHVDDTGQREIDFSNTLKISLYRT